MVSIGTKKVSTAVRFELTRVSPLDFESNALTARPSCLHTHIHKTCHNKHTKRRHHHVAHTTHPHSSRIVKTDAQQKYTQFSRFYSKLLLKRRLILHADVLVVNSCHGSDIVAVLTWTKIHVLAP